MVTDHESAKTHAERSREHRQRALVDSLAGFEALDRARQDASCHCQLVDTVAACDAKAYHALRQRFCRGASMVFVAPLWVR